MASRQTSRDRLLGAGRGSSATTASEPSAGAGTQQSRASGRTMARDFDVVGVGLNATDTLLVVPQFPAYGGKAPFVREIRSPGGQVASAMVTCAKLGLRTRYIGSVGDDEGGEILLQSLANAGIDITNVQKRAGCPNQSAYIVIDQTTGERTILWSRPDCLRIVPEQITPDQITSARLLHIDGHDTEAVEHAARIAHSNGIPVTVDVDTIYHGFDQVLPYVDYLIASTNFPVEWTSQRDPFLALELIQSEYGMRVAAMTLGPHGALALVDGSFHYSPAFVVNCQDTTGAGDVFHGAFCYAVVNGYCIERALEFSNAMAALNCKEIGAQGGIGTVAAAGELIGKAERRSNPEFADRARPGHR